MIPGISPWPMRNVKFWTATSACPVVTSDAASAPAIGFCRRATTPRRLTMPTTMMPVSITRAATKPSATPSFCRFRIGYRATPVPTIAKATMSSRTIPTITPMVLPDPRM